ncbi:Uncharacterised protein [Orientia tsutsugamushi]|uniref:Uncharacterized protein n=1 Tax=Orientia tsutsugamushi TaxID=784 RepID=A0A2U3RQ83_ORITS|nr:hypothetical protein OTSKARP_0680 [Orientia tsutsugamushi str. Karp]SPR15360.1 Uncharacterised protein [Orientia tsutsugamushi]
MLRNEFTKTIKIIPKDKIALIDESGMKILHTVTMEVAGAMVKKLINIYKE